MVTMSVGVALTSDSPERDLDEIIHAADVALYAAKAAGRNCVRVAQSLRSMVARKTSSRKVQC